MNAVEMMEPKMDAGMKRKPKLTFADPEFASVFEHRCTLEEVLTVCDVQMAMISSWLCNVESVDDTVCMLSNRF